MGFSQGSGITVLLYLILNWDQRSAGFRVFFSLLFFLGLNLEQELDAFNGGDRRLGDGGRNSALHVS